MTPETITTGVKKHKNKILGGGAGVTAVAIILFFWQMGIGPADLKALPGIDKRVSYAELRLDNMQATDAALMSEISELRKTVQQLKTEAATLTAHMETVLSMQDEMRQDIKELLRR